MKKILITGGTGFIGSYLVERNLKEGNIVRIFATSNNPKAEEYKKKNVEVFYGDIRDYFAVEKAVEGMNIVYHLAALVNDWGPKKLFRQINIDGTHNICKAAYKNNVQRLINVSTEVVFGVRKNEVVDESFDYQYWNELYPDTKLDAEKIVWKYFNKGLPISIIYPTWVYGPGDKTFIPILADAIKKRKMIFWRREAIFYPAYVENVVDLMVVIANDPKTIGKGFLVHDGVYDTLQNFTSRIAESIKAKKPKIHIPYGLAYSLAFLSQIIWKILRIKTRPFLTTFVVKNFGASTKYLCKNAVEILNWTPPISYEEGFSKTMNWLRSSDISSLKQK